MEDKDLLPPAGSSRKAAPRPASARQAALVMLGAVLLGLLIVAVWAYYSGALTTEEERPVQPKDREMLPTIALIAGRQFPGEDVYHKRQWGDSWTVEYEYLPPTAPPELTEEDPLRKAIAADLNAAQTAPRMFATLRLETNEPDARKYYQLQLEKWLTPSEQQRDSLFSGGDEAQCIVYTFDGKNQGNFFVCRQGERVLVAMIIGVWLDTPEAIAAAFGPLIDRLPAYDPQ